MAADPVTAERVLTQHYLRDHPGDAATTIERTPPASLDALGAATPQVLARVFDRLSPFLAVGLLATADPERAAHIVAAMRAPAAAEVLSRIDADQRERWLTHLSTAAQRELSGLLEYPPDSAGRLMSRRLGYFRREMTVAEASARLRDLSVDESLSLFLVDDDLRLAGRVSIQGMLMASADTRLAELAEPARGRVDPFTPRHDLAAELDRHRLSDLPVVDLEGRLIGVVPKDELVSAVQLDAAGDMQAMVGASRDERALSGPFFAVRKRLPWMQVNLVTAFLAASVVGLFEDTIAAYTALAVLLPVVAGQSGNAGAQALAVTMRGLALHEITPRNALALVFKEFRVGLMNGTAVALTTAAAVFIWSGSWGLALIIGSAMVVSMMTACMAGTAVPLTLRRLGQDPATSSSIFLTTVTDIAGFFSFLGIATIFAALL